jgi:hypothetical protein
LTLFRLLLTLVCALFLRQAALGFTTAVIRLPALFAEIS